MNEDTEIPAATYDEIAQEILELERWRREDLGFSDPSDWDMQEIDEPVTEQIINLARTHLNFVSAIAFGDNAQKRLEEEYNCAPDGPAVELVKSAQFREGYVYTPLNFERAVETCPTEKLAEALEDFAFSVSVQRWQMIEGNQALPQFTADGDRVAEVRFRASGCTQAIKGLFARYPELGQRRPIALPSHLQILGTTGHGARLVPEALGAIQEFIELHDAADHDRPAIRGRLGFTLTSVTNALKACWGNSHKSRRRGFHSMLQRDGPETRELVDGLRPILDDVLRISVATKGSYKKDDGAKLVNGIASLLNLPLEGDEIDKIEAAILENLESGHLDTLSPEDVGYLFYQALSLRLPFWMRVSSRGIVLQLISRIWGSHLKDFRGYLHNTIPSRRFVECPKDELLHFVSLCFELQSQGITYETEKAAFQDVAFLDAVVGLIAELALVEDPSVVGQIANRMEGFGPGALSWNIRAQTIARRLSPIEIESLLQWVRWVWSRDVPKDSNIARDTLSDAKAAVTKRIAILPNQAVGRVFSGLRKSEDDLYRKDNRRLEEVVARTLLHQAEASGDWSPATAERLRAQLHEFGFTKEVDWADGQLSSLSRLARALPSGDADAIAWLQKMPHAGHALMIAERAIAKEKALTRDQLEMLIVHSIAGARRNIKEEASFEEASLRSLLTTQE